MNNESDRGGAGFSFGDIGGGVRMKAGGDIVGRDKITTVGAEKGFAGEDQKQQFQVEIDQLRETLRAMKTSIEAQPTLSADDKDAMTAEILQKLTALKDVKEKTASLTPGTPAPANLVDTVEKTLDRANGVIDKLNVGAQKAGSIAETVASFAVKYGPLVLSARKLFGLP